MQAELEKLRFFAKPKLALDAVGGSSSLRIADCLAEVNFPYKLSMILLKLLHAERH